jgi:hypothetical protein
MCGWSVHERNTYFELFSFFMVRRPPRRVSEVSWSLPTPSGNDDSAVDDLFSTTRRAHLVRYLRAWLPACLLWRWKREAGCCEYFHHMHHHVGDSSSSRRRRNDSSPRWWEETQSENRDFTGGATRSSDEMFFSQGRCQSTRRGAGARMCCE